MTQQGKMRRQKGSFSGLLLEKTWDGKLNCGPRRTLRTKGQTSGEAGIALSGCQRLSSENAIGNP
jgi:hypothetical protein